MKKVWLGLAIGTLAAVGAAGAVQAAVPLDMGKGATNCIGYCVSNGMTKYTVPGLIDEFAQDHNPVGTGGQNECGAVGPGQTIRDLPPPQP